jgi:hypothetical protein
MRWTGADPEPDDSARKPARGRLAAVVCAWTAATVAATFLGWLAVGSVLLPTAQAPMTVVPVEVVATTRADDPSVPGPPSTVAADPSGSGSGSPSGSPSDSPSAEQSASASPSVSPSDDTSSADADIQRYSTAGGIVVLDVEANTVSLVSAVPSSGYVMQEWTETGWLRVDFTGSTTVYSVLATWNGPSPQVQEFQDPVN